MGHFAKIAIVGTHIRCLQFQMTPRFLKGKKCGLFIGYKMNIATSSEMQHEIGDTTIFASQQ